MRAVTSLGNSDFGVLQGFGLRLLGDLGFGGSVVLGIQVFRVLLTVLILGYFIMWPCAVALQFCIQSLQVRAHARNFQQLNPSHAETKQMNPYLGPKSM